jgi:hypothetical protein
MASSLLLPTYSAQLARIASAEQGSGWLDACLEEDRYLLPNRQFIEVLAYFIRTLPEEPKIEICAGQGELAEALADRGASLTPTDADPPAGSTALPLSAREALEQWRPQVVLGCFVPFDAGVDEAVLACPSVRHYLVLGARVGGEFGSASLWRTPGWQSRSLPHVGRWMLTRHDVWRGPSERPLIQHGEAWCFSR